MFCTRCNLHYPDHLNFCRRCGRTLVHTSGEAAVESLCCTRCGARVMREENFCQQCGYHLNIKTQETVVGACYHCAISWRSGWLFCRNCGLDRDRALMPPVSAPASPQSSVKIALKDLPKTEKIVCRQCGVEAKPYSRFCETCGSSFVVDRGKFKTPPASASIGTGFEKASSRPRRVEVEEAAAESRAASLKWGKAVKTVKQRRITSQFTGTSDLTTAERPSPPSQLQSQILRPEEERQRSTRADVQRLLVIGGLLLLVGGAAAYWYSQTRGPAPAPSQPAAKATQTALPAQSPTASLSTTDGMVYIPGGTLMMGREKGGDYDSPSYKVEVKPFLIDRTEVTNQAYQKFINETRRPSPSHWRNGKFREGEAKLPVVNVSWNDANAFAKWAKKRLPSEAEWEFAARGTDGRIYPWGNDWRADNANAGRGSSGRIVEVGKFNAGASPFGLLDMIGNVWELTSGGLYSYADRNRQLALGKVIRGGAYDVSRERATTTYRGFVPPDKGFSKTGFRCARDIR
jgi:formylglycine-generating enzyme required for sulfatase activity